MSRDRASLGYNVVYAVAIGIVSAGLLTAATKVLAPYREANERAEQIRDVLAVLDVPYPPDASSTDLIRIFETGVTHDRRGSLTVYRSMDAAGRTRAVAVPFGGRGLWGPVTGYLALEPDMRTVRAVTFRAPDETPGFGGEIVKAPFRDQFVGKKIVGPDGLPAMRVTRGDAPTAFNEVHAVTGATLTSDRVQAILTSLARRIVEEGGNVE